MKMNIEDIEPGTPQERSYGPYTIDFEVPEKYPTYVTFALSRSDGIDGIMPTLAQVLIDGPEEMIPETIMVTISTDFSVGRLQGKTPKYQAFMMELRAYMIDVKDSSSWIEELRGM